MKKSSVKRQQTKSSLGKHTFVEERLFNVTLKDTCSYVDLQFVPYCTTLLLCLSEKENLLISGL